MKRILIIILFFSSSLVWAQDNDTTAHSKLSLGEGLQLSLNEGRYQFKISGFIQPSYIYSKKDSLDKYQNRLSSKRTYLNFSGKALKEKVSFFFQADFSAATPLLDAYITYHLSPRWSVTVGQRRTFTNNKEMTFNEDGLQFTERAMTSTLLANNGREFGLFVEGKVGNEESFMIAPQIAITSGDGANSFGLNSTDTDLGGLKFGGRLDIYPMGDFKVGNRGFAHDIKHEETLKMALGVSGSLNRGANDKKGEGHGTFKLYNDTKALSYPDLRKLQADILLKVKGFSLLGEYVNTTGNVSNGTLLDSTAAPVLLQPKQISSYLILGNAINIQLGYVTKSGYAFNARYEYIKPEFGSYATSILKMQKVTTIGFTRYLRGNALKLQANGSFIQYDASKSYMAELVMQVVF